MSVHYLNTVVNHLSGKLQKDDPNDVVICCAIRTPLTKSKRGALRNAFPEDLLKPCFEAIIQKTRIRPSLIDDVCIGNVLQVGAGAISARLGELLAGMDISTPVYAVNRQFSIVLQAVVNIAQAIKAGSIDVGIGGGVECMTHYGMDQLLNPEKISEEVMDHELARLCLSTMGMNSEVIADRYGVNRKMQDEVSVLSHKKAVRAKQMGLFEEEIVPVRTKDDKGHVVTVKYDEGMRDGVTVESLAKLRPAFDSNGTTTAGNSSQVTDGASLVLLARRNVAERLQLPILARFVEVAITGDSPELLTGPVKAIPAVLKKTGLTLEDIDIFEINEAFATVLSYTQSQLGIRPSKINPKGGAIALGHPLGCTGARQIATLLPELRRTNGRYGIVSMCMATGLGAAAVIENLIRN